MMHVTITRGAVTEVYPWGKHGVAKWSYTNSRMGQRMSPGRKMDDGANDALHTEVQTTRVTRGIAADGMAQVASVYKTQTNTALHALQRLITCGAKETLHRGKEQAIWQAMTRSSREHGTCKNTA